MFQKENLGDEGLSSLEEHVVAHFKDGEIIKGVVLSFSPETGVLKLRLEDLTDQNEHEEIKAAELKAVYYIKNWSGNIDLHEASAPVPASAERKRFLVRFSDGEVLCGFVKEEDVDKIVVKDSEIQAVNLGFFLYPTDLNANNKKVFVLNSSVAEIRNI